MSKKSKKGELEKLVDNHHKLITTIGVFGALTALFSEYQRRTGVNTESIVLIDLAIVAVLFWELLDALGDLQISLKSFRKFTFQVLMIILFLSLLVFVASSTVPYYRIVAFLSFIGIYTALPVLIVKKVILGKQLLDEKEVKKITSSKYWSFAQSGLILVLGLIILYSASQTLNYFFPIS